MGVFFLIIFFFVSFLIVGLVLLQEGKGGGLTGMSTGMDGVMGAKNPLRRMTAYLFVFFVLMAITINWYFHQRADSSLPAAATNIPASNVRELQEESPMPGTMVVEGDTVPAEPVMAIPPQPEPAPAESETTTTPAPEQPATESAPEEPAAQ